MALLPASLRAHFSTPMVKRKHRKVGSETASPEQYKNSSIIRFGRLKSYIEEKLLVDYFAIQGNLKMIEGLEQYVEKNLDDLRAQPKIKILDVGPAIGALSTILVLQALEKHGLLEKTQVFLNDVSANVVDLTQQGDYTFPGSLVPPSLKGRINKKLREAKSYIGTAEELPWRENEFDVSLACFLFHHLHDSVKPVVANEIVRVTKRGGFLGVAEEWFHDYENDYAEKHQDDKISLAYESIISYRKLSKMLPETEVFYRYGTGQKENSYAFCAVKK
jgi:hypothetical protein